MSRPARLAASLTISSSALLFCILAGPALADPDKAAHVLAERFATNQEKSQRSAEESEMLKRAREEKLQREANEKAIAARKAALEKKRIEDEAQAQRLAAEQAEAKRIAEQRAEAELKAAEQKLAAERAEADRLAALKRTEDERLAQKKAEADRQAAEARADEDQQRQATLEREAEAKRLSDKLNRIREQRLDQARNAESPPNTNSPESDNQLGDANSYVEKPSGGMALGGPQTLPEESGPRFKYSEKHPQGGTARKDTLDNVTVLLVMKPGHRGIRRLNQVADPVLCTGATCYVSTGPSSPAKAMARGSALGPVNTLGKRAGACRRSLTCVYRGVDLTALQAPGSRSNALQPVDLKYLHHDRRTPVAVMSDSNCHARIGRLTCARLIKAETWSAWVVPEKVANEAGTEALVAALKSGLTTDQAAMLDER